MLSTVSPVRVCKIRFAPGGTSASHSMEARFRGVRATSMNGASPPNSDEICDSGRNPSPKNWTSDTPWLPCPGSYVERSWSL